MATLIPPRPSGPPVAAAPTRVLYAPRRRVRIETIALAAWAAITAIAFAGIGSRVFAPLWVAITVLTMLVVFFRNEPLFGALVTALFFFVPFYRRVLDLYAGYDPINPVLLAPPVSAMIGVITILRRYPELRGKQFAPILLLLLGLTYGYMIGLVKNGFFPATYSLLTWLAPLVFAAHLALSWRQYPATARAFGRLFVWAVPILAAYGIYQFVRLPAWDAAWLNAARMNSVGPAIPFAFRVFGSLNTPGPFALVLLVVILASLGLKSRFQWLSLTLGVVAMLLTRVRSSWVVFPVGLVILQVGSSLRKLPKQWLIIIAVGALVLPVLNLADTRGSVLRRIMSLSDISEDNSFQRRVALTRGFAKEIVDRAEGNGLGATGGASKLKAEVGVRSLDNGVLEVLFTLGWLGGMLYYAGFVILVGRVMTSINVRGDPFLAGVRAASAALTITLPVNEIFAGVIGHLTMMLIGLAMAARVHQVTVRHARLLAQRRPR